jgi:hypothetical protein
MNNEMKHITAIRANPTGFWAASHGDRRFAAHGPGELAIQDERSRRAAFADRPGDAAAGEAGDLDLAAHVADHDVGCAVTLKCGEARPNPHGDSGGTW